MTFSRVLWALSLSAFAMMACCSAEAQTITRYIPTSGTGNYPAKIVKGADGNLWFANGCSDEISKITPDGVITNYSAGVNPLACTNDLAVRSDGTMWFTMSDNANIGEITTAGTITLHPVALNPAAIAIGADGNIWFGDNAGGRIGKMTPSGQVTLYTAGLPASGIGSLTAAPDGNLWFLVDNGIGKITTNGQVTVYTQGLAAPVGLDRMVLGPDGNLWFTEQLAGGIGRITLSGTITQFPVSSGSAASANFYGAIGAGPDGKLWFGDLLDPYFYSITTSGVVTQYSAQDIASEPTSTVTSFVTGPDGNLWLGLSAGGGVDPVGYVVKMTLPAPSPLVAAVLPGSRVVKAGTPATLFATMLNSGSTALTNCRIGLPAGAPSGLSIAYQTTDPSTNEPTGNPNTPVTIPGNDGAQSFIVTFNAASPLAAAAQPLAFSCNGATAPETQWLNTVGIDFTDPSQPAAGDFIAVAASTTPGVVSAHVKSSAAFSVAMINNADSSYVASDSVEISVDTGLAGLPISTTLCQTNPSTSACLSPPTASLAPMTFPAGTVKTFAVFVTPTGPIAFNPAINRIFVRATGLNGPAQPNAEGPIFQGAASLAIETN